MSDNLDLRSELYSVRIKSTLRAIQDMTFEDFLKKHKDVDGKITSFDIFRNAVFDILLAMEYAIGEKDNKLIDLLNRLVKQLELEDEECSICGRMFAKLIKKTRNICEAGLYIIGIFSTFELKEFMIVFKEKIGILDNTEDGKTNEEFYNLLTRYSNN